MGVIAPDSASGLQRGSSCLMMTEDNPVATSGQQSIVSGINRNCAGIAIPEHIYPGMWIQDGIRARRNHPISNPIKPSEGKLKDAPKTRGAVHGSRQSAGREESIRKPAAQ